MYCPACGVANEDNVKFCKSCGEALTGETGQKPTGESGPETGQTPPPPPPPRPSGSSQQQPSGSGDFPFGDWIGRSFNVVLQDLVGFILLALVVGILSGITGGILAGPLYAGSLIVIRRNLRGQGKIDLSLVFSEGFKYFGQTFLLCFLSIVVIGIVMLILGKLPLIGGLLMSLVGLALSILVPIIGIAIHYITEENKDFVTAATQALNKVMENPVMFWVFGLVVGFVGAIGVAACGIGTLVTGPAALVIVALMLESRFPKK
ncbi:MAG: zinc-ribbon domain-containing protein [bacterium]